MGLLQVHKVNSKVRSYLTAEVTNVAAGIAERVIALYLLRRQFTLMRSGKREGGNSQLSTIRPQHIYRVTSPA